MTNSFMSPPPPPPVEISIDRQFCNPFFFFALKNMTQLELNELNYINRGRIPPVASFH